VRVFYVVHVLIVFAATEGVRTANADMKCKKQSLEEVMRKSMRFTEVVSYSFEVKCGQERDLRNKYTRTTLRRQLRRSLTIKNTIQGPLEGTRGPRIVKRRTA
jgi:hypothetical protein